jgi:hypothetical protein
MSKLLTADVCQGRGMVGPEVLRGSLPGEQLLDQLNFCALTKPFTKSHMSRTREGGVGGIAGVSAGEQLLCDCSV